MHSICIELEFGECDQDDREDDVQVERDGVLLEEVDMVVMVITAEKDVESEGAAVDVDMLTHFHRMELSAEAMELTYTREPKADEECVMEGLEDFLAGLEIAQKHITDVAASGEAETDAPVAGFRVMRGQETTIEPVVPMDHRMGGDRTIERVQAA